MQERVQQSLQVVAEAEKRLVELQKEKKQVCITVCVSPGAASTPPTHAFDLNCPHPSQLSSQLESNLQRAPKQGGRVTRHSKQTQVRQKMGTTI